MRVIETAAAFRDARAAAREPVGLVPTMGFLHEGHMSLARRARAENSTAIATIFVNPAQFGPNEDYDAYPRDMDADLAKLEGAGIDIAFTPPVSEVYPPGFDSYVDVGRIGERLEGAHRARHFRGVATVVCKLLALARPHKAYFGQKDAQQCLVVKRLNADLNLGADIVVCPTVRDADGLALSSRNAYLRPSERSAALSLHQALRLATDLRGGGATDAREIRARMRRVIERHPEASIDYISVADAETLDEIDELDAAAGGALASLAVRVGKTRLIDNVIL